MSRRVLADFDAELLLRLGNRTDITSTMRGFFLQDAARSVANAVVDPALQKTTNMTLAGSTDNIDPTAAPNNLTDIWWAESLKNLTDGWFIVPADRQEIEQLITKQSGPPFRYYWFGGKFYFDTLANGAKTIQLWYKRKPAEFTVSPETDSIFDVVIIMKAAQIGFETVRDFDEAAKQRAMIGQYVRENNLPVNMAKLDDYRQGLQVRLR